MSEKKILNEEDLNKVAGGEGGSSAIGIGKRYYYESDRDQVCEIVKVHANVVIFDTYMFDDFHCHYDYTGRQELPINQFITEYKVEFIGNMKKHGDEER